MKEFTLKYSAKGFSDLQPYQVVKVMQKYASTQWMLVETYN